MNARPAPTSRPVNTAMNAPMAEPRRSSPFAATAAIAGVAAPNPVSSAPATARIMPTERMARTRSRARNIAKPSNATPTIPIGIQSQIHCLTVNRVSTAEFCDTVADASSTLAGSFFESDGLIVCSAARMVVEACCASMSTRRLTRASNTWWWARTANSRIAFSTGGVAIAEDSASVTSGRAPETKLDVRASRSVAWSAM